MQLNNFDYENHLFKSIFHNMRLIWKFKASSPKYSKMAVFNVDIFSICLVNSWENYMKDAYNFDAYIIYERILLDQSTWIVSLRYTSRIVLILTCMWSNMNKTANIACKSVI